MSPNAIQISAEHPLAKLSKERDRITNMIAEVRGREPDARGEGVDELQRSLEHELQAVDAAWHREADILAGGGSHNAALAKGQSMQAAVGAPSSSDPSLSAIVRGLGLGDWGNVMPDVKAMILSGGAAAAVPGYVTAGIVDLAREQSVIFRAGAQLIPISSPTAKVARMVSEPAVQFAPESAERDLTDGAFVFDAAELTASSAFLYSTYSIEAAEDCVDLEQALQTSFAAQLSLAFDRAAIAGTGTDQPLGIINMNHATHRIQEQAAVGVASNYLPFITAMGSVLAAHHSPSSVIYPVPLWTKLAGLTDTTNQPLRAPQAYGQLTEYVSGYLPANGGTGTNEITAIVGDLSALTVGVRTNLTIEVSRLGSGFKKGSIEVRAFCRFGCYLTRPDALLVMRGIKVA